MFMIRLVIAISLIFAYPSASESRNAALKSYRSVLYIWSGQDSSVPNASDFVAVIDFDEFSPTYGSILRVVPLVSDPSNGIGQSNNEPHHSSISSDGKYYISGGLLSFLSNQKEIFIWKIPRNPLSGPEFVCAVDAPRACPDEFEPIGNSQFLLSMMCDENASSPGDIVVIDAATCTATSLLKDRSALENFNPHGFGRLNNGSILVGDYVVPITLAGSDASQIVFQNTARHFFPDGTLQQTVYVPFPTDPGSGTGLGTGIGFMELKAIPNDPLGRAYACGTNTNTLYLFGTSMVEAIPVLDVSAVNGYIKVPSAGILSIFPNGKHMVMTFQMRFLLLVDIAQPTNPKILRTFDFCSDIAIKNSAIQIPGANNATTFAQFCAENNNIVGTHVIVHPEGENRFVVFNYFLKFGLAQFEGTRTVHAFKLNKELADFTYDHRFNPNFASLSAYPHHAAYIKQ